MRLDKSFFEDTVLIEIDYKQKILIGKSPLQVYGKNDQDEINFRYYDLIYKGSQDGSATIAAFKYMRKYYNLKKKSIRITEQFYKNNISCVFK
ncbi:hypothetical protein BpHYR1_006611 [Brachionus plicatilis]|uniref:Uncharacterized protein n=1 Tax=Brachionus plicatilis TaxID=10195 RepID=A0A3M7QLB5_BRAPC|nr:hypothetical protein BpHYR1_006611 [Brachionus plicatilis]